MVDISIAEALHLEGAELLVFSALSYLSSSKPWKGSMEELAKMSRCGSRLTAWRALEKLVGRNVVVETEKGWSVQNEQSNVQNEQNSVQNEQNPKRKEPKEKYNIKVSQSVIKPTDPKTDGRTCFLEPDFLSFWSLWKSHFCIIKKKIAKDRYQALREHFDHDTILRVLNFAAAQSSLTGKKDGLKMSLYWFCDHFGELMQRCSQSTKVQIFTISEFVEKFGTTDKAGFCYLKERTEKGERLLCKTADAKEVGMEIDRLCYA